MEKSREKKSGTKSQTISLPNYKETHTCTCDLWGSPDPDLMIRSSHEIKSICVSRLHASGVPVKEGYWQTLWLNCDLIYVMV